MLTFLEVNGQSVEASDPELADWILSLSAGTSAGRLAELIRERLRSLR
jgi:prophage maintenance system killer protein